jgi:heparosan-N-sulfate-glucuronate 5-epimerase
MLGTGLAMRHGRERLERLKLGVAREAKGSVLEHYYVNFRDWVSFVEDGCYGPLDEEGIPLVDYERHSRIQGGGKEYFAVTIAQYALGNFELWLETRWDKYREKFLRLAHWLETNAETVGKDVVVWSAKFDWPAFGLSAPWISSMAQGEAVSVLLRAHQIERREVSLELTRKAAASFFIPVGEPGGVKYVDKDGDVWFEEYITEPPAHVLNGFVFSLFGLLDYARVTGDEKARKAWEQGVLTLERKLHLFDTGCWSRYDLLRDRVASEFYHGNIHVPLLKAMHLATGKQVFLDFAQRWERYQRSRLCRTRAKYYRFPSRALGRIVRLLGESQ